MPKLVNLGSLCIDHVYRVSALAGAGETVSSKSHEVFPGGKGLNQSLAAARAGAVTVHVGCVGEDGEMLRQILAGAGVDTSGLRSVSGTPSGHAVIQVDEQGQNAIVIAGGANRSITAVDRDRVATLLDPGDWLLLQNEINDLPAALALTRATGAKLAFNVAPVDGRESTYDLEGVDLLIVNEIEARALVPADVAAQGDSSVARWLAHSHKDMDVVLTLGAAGLLHAKGSRVQTHAAIAVTPIDETAAGDAFIGYLIAGLLSGAPMARALRLGTAAGALAVTRAGAAVSIPERSAVEAMSATGPDLS